MFDPYSDRIGSDFVLTRLVFPLGPIFSSPAGGRALDGGGIEEAGWQGYLGRV
jgi:hypothetical protein